MAAGKRERVVFQMSASKREHLSHSLSSAKETSRTTRLSCSAAMGRHLHAAIVEQLPQLL